MTREEAIAYGKECLSWNKFSKDMKMYQFIEMAIKTLENHDTFMKYAYSYGKQDALSQEPCTDAVSRQAVLDLVNSDWKYEGLETDVASLPSVTLKPIECDDAVSRDALLGETIRKNSIWNSITNSEGKNLEEIILELPPVNPQYTGNEFFNFDAPMVKKSMEQDAISREDAYKIVTEPDTPFGKHKGTLIRELPSVNPQPSEHFIDGVHAMGYREGYKDAQKQKSGRWLITSISHIAYCSECDYLFKDIPASIVEHFKHCPNCGCRMESDVE